MEARCCGFHLLPNLQGTFIILDNHDNQHHSLPSPEILRVHHALARVFHTSGAAESIDEILRESTETRVMAADGSTDAFVLLTARLARTGIANYCPSFRRILDRERFGCR